MGVGVAIGVVFFMTTHIGCYFGYQKLIYISIRPKFNIWTPINWVSVINDIEYGLTIATPTGSCFVIKS